MKKVYAQDIHLLAFVLREPVLQAYALSHTSESTLLLSHIFKKIQAVNLIILQV